MFYLLVDKTYECCFDPQTETLHMMLGRLEDHTIHAHHYDKEHSTCITHPLWVIRTYLVFSYINDGPVTKTTDKVILLIRVT